MADEPTFHHLQMLSYSPRLSARMSTRKMHGVGYQLGLGNKVPDNDFDNLLQHPRLLLEDWEVNFPGMVRQAHSESGLRHARCEWVKVAWNLGHPGSLNRSPSKEDLRVVLEIEFSGVERSAPSLEDSVEAVLFPDAVMEIIREQVMPRLEFTERGEFVWTNPTGS